LNSRILYALLGILLGGNVSFAQSGLDQKISDLNNENDDQKRISLAMEISRDSEVFYDGLFYAKFAIDVAEKSEDQEALASTYQNLAGLYSKEHRPKEAAEWGLKALNLWRANSNRKELAASFEFLGNVYHEVGDLSSSLKSYLGYSSVCMEIGDLSGVANSKNKIGTIHKELGDYAFALGSYADAVKVYEKVGKEAKKAGPYLNIGIIYKIQKEHGEALVYYRKALALYQMDGNQNGAAAAYVNIGNIHRMEFRFDSALFYSRKAVEIHDQNNKLAHLSFAYNNIGLIYSEQGINDSALFYYNASLTLKDSVKAVTSRASTLTNIGEVYTALKQHDKAQTYLAEALQLASDLKQDDVMEEVYTQLAKLENSRGNFKKSVEYLNIYIAFHDSVDNIQKTRLLNDYRAKYEYEQQSQKLELSEKKKALLEERIANDHTQRSQSRIISIALGALLILVFLLLWSYYRRLSVTKELNKQLQDTNEELKSTLLSKEEKELLLKEIHHRVKNNLQIISSLIRLQWSKINDPEIEDLFRECDDRVKSMSLVHEELYKTKNLSKVNVGKYLEKLSGDLIDVYSVGRAVKLNITSEVEALGIDTLIPLGLMINEIITNSLKHGLVDSQPGEITVELTNRNNKEFTLVIGDNGRGFPGNFSFESEESLGVELISTLTEQLNGQIEILPREGAFFKIDFEDIDKERLRHEIAP